MQIVTLSELSKEQLQELVGKRVIFGGRGLLDGLKDMTKSSAIRVLGVPYIEMLGICLRIKEYCGKRTLLLPECNFNQQAAILTEKEYKELPQW